MKVPKIEKNLSSFLLEEDGKVTSRSVLSLGAILAGISIAAMFGPSEIENAEALRIRGRVNFSHTSHSSHGSHGSHASHASY